MHTYSVQFKVSKSTSNFVPYLETYLMQEPC
jgi:hypothetical protein